jgi:transcriptional/translational regulatory protein YebC/TACO1
VAKKDAQEDALMAAALDAGAEDVREEDDDNYEIITAPEDFDAVKKALEDAGIPIGDAEVTMLPQSYVSLTGKDAELMLKLMDALDDSDDVQKVYTNADIADDAITG